MQSVPLKKAWKIAEQYNRTLKATDPRLRRCVQIIHEEGTTYLFRSAFLMTWKDPEYIPNPNNAAERPGEWLVVFTEHQGFHVFSYDELINYAQFERIGEIEELG